MDLILSSEEKECCIKVSNLHEDVSFDDLYQHFKEFGQIQLLCLNKNLTATVIYNDKNDTKTAIQILNYDLLHGKRIIVEQMKPTEQLIKGYGVFETWFKFTKEEKEKQFDTFIQFLITHRTDFNNIVKFGDKIKLLGQLIYYKIQNFDKISIPFTSDETIAQLSNFKDKATSIVPLLINIEVLEIDEIIEIASDSEELFSRCEEACQLLDNYQNSSQINPIQ